jgi:S1-C subfamily serine protease
VTGFDLLVLVLLPFFAWAGYRQGFLVSVLSFGGFLVGVVLGLAAAPVLLGSLSPGLTRAALALALVLLLGAVVQSLAAFLGRTLRAVVSHGPTRWVDNFLGAVGAAVLLTLSAWLLGEAAGRSPSLPFATSMRDSEVVQVVGDAVPVPPGRLVSAFAGLVAESGFPSVFGDAVERIAPVAPPDPQVLGQPGVRAAEGSLVKVVADARSCRARLEGSGFVVAPGRIMTNAHVVAGSNRVRVLLVGRGAPLEATVVFLDPRTDVAVLAVKGLDAPALTFDATAVRGDDAVVAGFPQDGPLAAGPARIRSVLVAVGHDIYGEPGARREVYSLRASVREGNSGGPLLAPDGKVLGVVFAASVDNPQTGYALTAKAVKPALAAGRTASAPVATGACAD